MHFENEEELCKLLIGSSESKYPKEDVAAYVQQLCSYGVDKLTKEQDRISEEKLSVVQQCQELAYQNYPTFIETAHCSKELIQNVSSIKDATIDLASDLETLKVKCNEFSEKSRALNGARRLTSLALSRHTQLLEILELPQLMDTCVRNGYWEEALELSAYVARLERKLGYIPLICNIAQEVQSCTRLMLSQLIGQLRMPAQLPHCLKVMGYLRRIGVFSEEELRLKFLQARDSWFRSTITDIPKEDAYQHILKTVELSRVHLFDIATQYRAIFSDEDPLVLANQDPCINECGIFHAWITQKVKAFVAILESDLPRLSPTLLESVLGQCMYFGLSFGRIGFDFRGLLIPAFVQTAKDRFDHALSCAELQFANSIASINLSRNPTSASIPAISTTADQLQPPYALMEFRPLAELCNGIINAFNDLRLCAPLLLVDHTVDKLATSLQNCAQLMADIYRHDQEAFSSQERKNYLRLLRLFSTEFLSYVQKVLHAVFPPSHLALQTSFTTTELQKHGVGVLNTGKIVKCIEHLIDLPNENAAALDGVDNRQSNSVTSLQDPTEKLESEPLEPHDENPPSVSEQSEKTPSVIEDEVVPAVEPSQAGPVAGSHMENEEQAETSQNITNCSPADA